MSAEALANDERLSWPPGKSSYSSHTMSVGDGTWDLGRQTFLLPNLLGLNYATTRYNGMGNRFLGAPQYRHLVLGHGILASIVFLGIIPIAIFFARFYGGVKTRAGRRGVKLHIWLQVLTFLLGTVVLTLGWFAVGPTRTVSNPHHSIGIALYVLIVVQIIGGSIAHRGLNRKRSDRISLKVMFHYWLGRIIAGLGMAQIPLGLALYGSPLYLFILYAVIMLVYIIAYFILSYKYQNNAKFYHCSKAAIRVRPGADSRRNSHSHHHSRDARHLYEPKIVTDGMNNRLSAHIGRNQDDRNKINPEFSSDIEQGDNTVLRMDNRYAKPMTNEAKKWPNDIRHSTYASNDEKKKKGSDWKEKLMHIAAGVITAIGKNYLSGRRKNRSIISDNSTVHSSRFARTDILDDEEQRNGKSTRTYDSGAPRKSDNFTGDGVGYTPDGRYSYTNTDGYDVRQSSCRPNDARQTAYNKINGNGKSKQTGDKGIFHGIKQLGLMGYWREGAAERTKQHQANRQKQQQQQHYEQTNGTLAPGDYVSEGVGGTSVNFSTGDPQSQPYDARRYSRGRYNSGNYEMNNSGWNGRVHAEGQNYRKSVVTGHRGEVEGGGGPVDEMYREIYPRVNRAKQYPTDHAGESYRADGRGGGATSRGRRHGRSKDDSNDNWRRVEAMEASQVQEGDNEMKRSSKDGGYIGGGPVTQRKENTEGVPTTPGRKSISKVGGGVINSSLSSPGSGEVPRIKSSTITGTGTGTGTGVVKPIYPSGDGTFSGTDLSGTATYDSNRRRRRAERAQARLARAAGITPVSGMGRVDEVNEDKATMTSGHKSGVEN